MRVVHIATADFWGPGVCAYRLHKGLQRAGVDSQMLTLVKSTGDSSVKMVIKDLIDNTKFRSVDKVLPDTESISNFAIARWKRILDIDPMPREGELVFSLGDGEVDFSQIPQVEEADIIHIHWAPGFLNHERIGEQFIGRPVVLTLYDVNPFTGGCHFLDGCGNYKNRCVNCPKLPDDKRDIAVYMYEVKKRSYELLNLLVVASNSWLKSIAMDSGMFDVDIKVVVPGVPTNTFLKLNKSRIKSHLLLPDDRYVVVFSSSFLNFSQNRISDFIEALSIVARYIPVYLVLLGSHLEEVKCKTNFPVHSVGFVPHEEIMAWYYSAGDVFVSTYTNGYLPISVLEAMSCGLPVVGFDNSGIKDVVEHKRNGYLAEEGSIEGLCNGIRWVLEDQGRRERLSQRARRVVREKFTLTHQVEKYVELYTEVLNLKDSIKRDKYIKWGEELFSNRKMDMAEQVFKKMLEKNENDAEILNNLGVIYWEKGMYNRAFSYFKKAYEINPFLEDIKNNYQKAIKIVNSQNR